VSQTDDSIMPIADWLKQLCVRITVVW